MQHQKILNLLNEANNSKFVTKNGTLSITIEERIMVLEIKLAIIQKF